MNVVVIMTHSLRYDHVHSNGNDWIQTPCLDKLASEGAAFDRAYSEGLPTLPTRTALFTGRYTFPFRGWQHLEPTDRTLAEWLWERGYRSCLVTDTYHMHKPGMGYERGFDCVEFIRGQEGDPHVVDESLAIDVDSIFKHDGGSDGKGDAVRGQVEAYLRNTHHWKGEQDHFVAEVCTAAMDWLERQPRRENLFLWVDCFDPHEPWDPPAPYNRLYQPDYQGRDLAQPIPREVDGYLSDDEVQHIRALYAGEVTLVDTWVGRLLDKIDELGLRDDTLVIHLSDHGEPLGHGGWGHGIIRKASPWPYEELIHIPLTIRHPGGLGAGQRFDAFVETCDIMPTILDFLRLPGPPHMHGRSALPIMAGRADAIRDAAYSGFYLKSWSIREGDWKYILWLPQQPDLDAAMPGTLGAISCTLVGSLETPQKPELYNLAADPDESSNLVDQQPELAGRLELKLRRFVASLI